MDRNDSKPTQVLPLDTEDHLAHNRVCDRGAGYAGVFWIHYRREFPWILFSKIWMGKNWVGGVAELDIDMSLGERLTS